MIKLNGSVSRKVPVPGVDFSSQSFGAGMEVEVGNNVTPEEIKKKFRNLYRVLEESVKEQISANGGKPAENDRYHASGNGGNPGRAPITQSQKNLIEKLVSEQAVYGRERTQLLNIKTKNEATRAIKKLLNGKPQRR